MLLTTKLFRPKPSPTYLQRQRLIAQLDQGGHSDLTLIAAPAGYGKTTVVAAWLAQHDELPSCWVSLDERDNNPKQFWRYVVAALRQIDSSIGNSAEQALQLAGAVQLDNVLLSLINDIWQRYQQHEQQWALVLDDYHVIHTPDIHESLDLFIENMPPQALRLVMTTRSDPPLNLARRRARQQLCELRLSDLRFQDDEIAQLLNDQLGLALSAESLSHLSTHTEGWIAALQLTSLSLKTESDPQAFVTALAKNNRFVADYLTEEVIAHQPDDVRIFLEQTAPLAQFSTELLNHLFPQLDSVTMLRRLEAQNLFLIPLDIERTQFRYHHLFASLLRQRNSAELAGIQQAALQKASAWHAVRGEYDLAIEYAQQMGDHELVAQHILQLSQPFPDHEALRLSWLDALPDEQFIARPELHIVRALILIFVPTHAAIERARVDTQHARARMGNRLQNDPYWNALLLANEFSVGQAQGKTEPETNVADLEDAIDQLIDKHPALRGRLLYTLGWKQFLHVPLAQTIATFQEAMQLAETHGDTFIAVSSQLALWVRREQQGNKTATILREVSQFLEQSPLVKSGYPLTAGVWRIQGVLLLHRGEVAAAVDSLTNALNLISLISEYGQELVIRWSLAHALYNLGRQADALAMVDSIPERIPLLAELAPALRRWILQWELDADSAEAEPLFSGDPVPIPSEGEPPSQTIQVYVQQLDAIARARILIRQGNLESVTPSITFLKSHLAPASVAPRKGIFLRVNIALLLAAQGKQAEALSYLRQAVEMAQNSGGQLPFLEARQPAIKLLQTLRASDGPAPYLDTLITASQQHFAMLTKVTTASPSPLSATSVPDALTERERELLHLIAEGLTNKQIAARLYLSPNTVRVHTSNIYGKLGVPNRTQAAAKARELGLL